MRIFTAGLATETNTFAPWPTGDRAFDEGGRWPGNASLAGDCPENLVARLYRTLAGRDGHDFVEGLFASAEPSGPTVQAVFESLRDQIVDEIRSAGPFDVILLYLHGAMVATECEDCEADLVIRIRDVVGRDAAIGVELDPHCHLSQALVDAADLVICMKEYPHIDFLERAEELYGLCVRKAAGEIALASHLFDCRMVGFYPTTMQPMAGLLEQMKSAELEPGVASVSFVHGFPWGDTFDNGSKVLVVTEGDATRAAALAERLGRAFYAQREALLQHFPGMEEALDLAFATPGRVVIADTADNAGGGAPSDNVTLLTAMLRRNIRDACFGCIWDPIAAGVCAESGVGTKLRLRLGGKCGPASGEAADFQVRVRAVRTNHDQAGLGTSRAAMGLSVWLEIEGIDVVVNSIRTQTFAPDAFTGLGIALEGKRLIVVKSSQHFQTHFASLADRVIHCATPGAVQMDFAALPFRRRRDLNYFPRVAAPLS
ncbi:M81 family metallopeptidase [Lichenicoccus sp.]|uniref:M81 family metallopeptidase n=1 Tax=Lichenicoccus sp. TaxID=2781899 RepID=UPI003D124228